MLSEQERTLVRQLWARGPAVLAEAGFNSDAVKVFMSRADVQADLMLLDEEYKHETTITGRTRYMAQRNLARLSDGAAAVMARAMAGPEYLRHPETQHILTDARGNPILKTAETSSNQIRAAQSVLNTFGLGDTRVHVEHRADFNLNVLVDAQRETPEVEFDPDHATEEERALSRERVRNTIELLSEKLPRIRETVEETLGLAPPKPKRTAKKKTSKKKTSKKKVTKKKASKKVSSRRPSK